jgi:hypothetical protein
MDTRELDECIRRTLRREGAITPDQKARAWERLAAAAAQQTMLDPAEASSPSALRRMWLRLCAAVSGAPAVRALHRLAMDEQRYQRASACRHAHLSKSASAMGFSAQSHYVFSYYHC